MTPESAAQIAADRAIASQGLLRLSDFPVGWTEAPRKAGAQSHLGEEVAACLHVPASLLAESGPTEAESPKFREPGGDSVENSVTVVATNAIAAEYVEAFKKAQAPSCLTTAVQKILAEQERKEGSKLPPGSSFGAATVEPMSFPPEGERSIAYRVDLPVEVNAVTIRFYLDAVIVQVGRAYASVTFSGTDSPVEASMEESLVKLTIGRLGGALGVGASTTS